MIRFGEMMRGVEALKHPYDTTSTDAPTNNLIERKTQLLCVIVTCVARGDLGSQVQNHMLAAQKTGVTPEEIMEALDLVGTWIGRARKNIGLEAWRATFRPELPSLDRVEDPR